MNQSNQNYQSEQFSNKFFMLNGNSKILLAFLFILIIVETNYIFKLHSELEEAKSRIIQIKLNDTHSEHIDNQILFQASNKLDLTDNLADSIIKSEKIEKVKEVEKKPLYSENYDRLEPQININSLVSNIDNNQNIINSVPVTVKEKKKRFFQIMIPIVRKVKKEFDDLYLDVLTLRNKEFLTEKDQLILDDFYDKYEIKSREIDDLLLAIKPHPISVVLAQAALESSWGRSRLFLEENAVFVIWTSKNAKNKLIVEDPNNPDNYMYVKSYDSLEESIKEYFEILNRKSAYKKFREVRARTNDPYLIIKELEYYAESREEYVDKLRRVIYANDLTKYDTN